VSGSRHHPPGVGSSLATGARGARRRRTAPRLPHNTEHILTGPEALSYADAAAIVAQRTGTPVRHRSVTADELARHFTGHGVPADFSALLAALDNDIRAGAEDRVTDTVERITGRPARGFRGFAESEIR
jgi:uncharacterized protein YbjT (DUF2867 family)